MTPPALPAALLDFIERFNRGEYWESHELLEGPWRESRSDFYQGLILYASAFVHLQRRNPRGVLAQLRKTERRLALYRPAYCGLDVEAILAHAARSAALARREPVAWQMLLPPPLEPRPEHIRGDEPELRNPFTPSAS